MFVHYANVRSEKDRKPESAGQTIKKKEKKEI